MTNLPSNVPAADVKLYTAAACRAIDAAAMAPQSAGGMGLSGDVLMERAAQFALDTLMLLCPNTPAVTIVCGKGNNAGDGYWLAYLAQRLGIAVQIIAVGSTQELTGDALNAWQQAAAAGLSTEESDAGLRYPVIVDALLGTGSRGAPRPGYAEMIDEINQTDAFVLSLDLPSGLNADTGEAALAVQANATVSFIARNIGLYTGRGPGLAGQRFFSDLGVSSDYAAPRPFVPLRFWRPSLLPKVPIDTYKHRRGHVVIVGGCTGMGGAVILAAEAALRSGAGLVTVATDASNLPGLQARLPEAMWVDPVNHETAVTLEQVLERADVVVLGPGLGRSDWARRVLSCLCSYRGPMVVDADGLFWLAQFHRQSKQFNGDGPLYLTPHEGEAAILLGRTVTEVSRDRFSALSDMTRQYQALGLIKGPGTVMGDPAHQAICGHGNPGMASAGMGDVLAGLSGSLLAQQGADQASAFAAAVLLHSAAADQAAQEIGLRSVTASSVIERIPQLLHATQ